MQYDFICNQGIDILLIPILIVNLKYFLIKNKKLEIFIHL